VARLAKLMIRIETAEILRPYTVLKGVPDSVCALTWE
jgi:hypothetical protein